MKAGYHIETVNKKEREMKGIAERNNTNLWHLEPMNAAMMLQSSQADGLPYCLTFWSHFLQIAEVLPLLVCWNSVRQ